MTIKDFFNLLTEAYEVNELNEKLAGKVSQEFLNKLSSKMKPTNRGTYYDDIAVAIIKYVQNNPKDSYVINNPGAVYTILKKARSTVNKFNPNEILTNSKGNQAYWKNLYNSYGKKEERISSNAEMETKDLGNVIAYIPKTYYNTESGFKEIDMEKSWTNLRKLSAQMAKKDKSGETAKDEDNEIMQANANHWCVASSDKDYYRRYKDKHLFDSIFIILVKKDANGKPDYSKRYLLAIYNDNEFSDNIYEFADKFNKHYRSSIIFPRSEYPKLKDFIKSVIKSHKYSITTNKTTLRNKKIQDDENLRENLKSLTFNNETRRYDYDGEKEIYIEDLIKDGKFIVPLGVWNGDFTCSNCNLTSLKNAPTIVRGNFRCDNNNIGTLIGVPDEIDGVFSCSHCKLTSLKDGPSKVRGNYVCSFNNIETLDGVPSTINYSFSCNYNKLTSLKGAPTIVKGNFECSHNLLTSLDCPNTKIGNSFYCNGNKLTSLDGVPTYKKIACCNNPGYPFKDVHDEFRVF